MLTCYDQVAHYSKSPTVAVLVTLHNYHQSLLRARSLLSGDVQEDFSNIHCPALTFHLITPLDELCPFTQVFFLDYTTFELWILVDVEH